MTVKELVVHRDNGTVAVDHGSFDLHAGEIVGLCGVEGNGQTELLQALAGMRPIQAGEITYAIGHGPVTNADAGSLRRIGVAHIPEDRLHYAIVAAFSLTLNWLLRKLSQPRFAAWGLLRRQAAAKATAAAIKDNDVRASGPRARMADLSGGNQQKFVIARELSDDVAVILAGHPTRGLDIRTVVAIRNRLVAERARGVAILLLSADLVRSLGHRRSHHGDGARTAARPGPRGGNDARGNRALDDNAMSPGMTRVVRVGVVLIVAALVPSLFVLIAGHNPWRVFTTLVLYAFGPQGWSEVLVHAIPLTLIGLGVAFALRAGLFNIGADGQLIAGAVLAVFLAPYLAGWGIAGLLVFLILGSIGGAALGALVGYLRAWFGASEIIVTIMLNYVMVQMISYLIRGPMQESSRFWPQSYLIPEDCFLPVIVPGTRLHAGLFVALFMVIVGAVVQRQTVLGFRAAVLGANPGAAAYAGFHVKILTVIVMAISGGLAGLAGAVEVGGIYQRLQDNMSEGFGLAAIAVALIARLEAAAIPLAACLFGVFFAGAGALQRELALPFPLVWIIEAAVIFAVAAVQWALPSRKAIA